MEEKTQGAIPLDGEGFYRASLMYCRECGYPHRVGPKGPDHGGRPVVVSYALADAEKAARLAEEDAAGLSKLAPVCVRAREVVLPDGDVGLRVSIPPDAMARVRGKTERKTERAPKTEQPEAKTERGEVITEQENGTSKTKRPGRKRSLLTKAERQAAYRARKVQGGQ